MTKKLPDHFKSFIEIFSQHVFLFDMLKITPYDFQGISYLFNGFFIIPYDKKTG